MWARTLGCLLLSVTLSGMAQALFIGGSAVLIALQAYERLQHPQPVAFSG